MLGVSPRTVTRLVARGQLSPVRIGARSTRFRSSDIEGGAGCRRRIEVQEGARPGVQAGVGPKGARGRAHGGILARLDEARSRRAPRSSSFGPASRRAASSLGRVGRVGAPAAPPTTIITHPSTLDVGDDGRALLLCRSRGCSVEAICDRLGPRSQRPLRRRPRPSPLVMIIPIVLMVVVSVGVSARGFRALVGLSGQPPSSRPMSPGPRSVSRIPLIRRPGTGLITWSAVSGSTRRRPVSSSWTSIHAHFLGSIRPAFVGKPFVGCPRLIVPFFVNGSLTGLQGRALGDHRSCAEASPKTVPLLRWGRVAVFALDRSGPVVVSPRARGRRWRRSAPGSRPSGLRGAGLGRTARGASASLEPVIPLLRGREVPAIGDADEPGRRFARCVGLFSPRPGSTLGRSSWTLLGTTGMTWPTSSRTFVPTTRVARPARGSTSSRWRSKPGRRPAGTDTSAGGQTTIRRRPASSSSPSTQSSSTPRRVRRSRRSRSAITRRPGRFARRN